MHPSRLLRRHFWLPTLAMVAAAAFVSARAVNALVGMWLGPTSDGLAHAATTPDAPPPLASVKSADAILTRNPFDSVTGPLVGKPPPPDDEAALPTCDGYRVHVIVASDDPEWSFASLTSPSEPKHVLRRRGGSIGDREIAHIGIDKVWLSTGGRVCQVDLYAPPPAQPPKDKGTTQQRVGEQPAAPDWLSKGITRVSPREFRIDRSVRDRILEGGGGFLPQLRFTPEMQGGKVIGLKLGEVRPESIPGMLGLKAGDRLQTINGFDVTEPTKMLEAYGRLTTESRWTLHIVRDGQPTNLDYRIE